MATQLLGGALADRFGGKRVLAGGIAWFSAASLLLPAALSPPVAAKGLALPAMLMARCFVVSAVHLLWGECIAPASWREGQVCILPVLRGECVAHLFYGERAALPARLRRGSAGPPALHMCSQIRHNHTCTHDMLPAWVRACTT